jgi:hypothetical protein
MDCTVAVTTEEGIIGGVKEVCTTINEDKACP